MALSQIRSHFTSDRIWQEIDFRRQDLRFKELDRFTEADLQVGNRITRQIREPGK